MARVRERGVRANLGHVQISLHFAGLSALSLVMPTGLRRFHRSGQSHFVTFTCYHRRAYLNLPDVCDLFVQCLESMRCRFAMCVYGYVVMPEHVHLLVDQPEEALIKYRFANGGWVESGPQRLKPLVSGTLMARLKPCPSRAIRQRTYSLERSQFCSRSPLTRENSLSLSVTIT